MASPLKKITFGDGKKKGRAIYVILENQELGGHICVFSGNTRKPNTTFYLEELIGGICKAEGLKASEITFFELATRRGGYKGLPGYFDFNQVEFGYQDGQIIQPRWRLVYCPDEIVKLFRRQIGWPP